eukprot:CAMPEP_0174382132 /NCGR_PEP_ID=MMETSP0811_2-20130205/124428_1 /TAXON_ID=73025 ORGANISM="Eutreptiella gymnastica-like, Strain CCMP1594" /NCGR_SAMPLE_ID=MMETSP0811_2 /ASSEMBLY_ACC=CAM_ASM_000667 /LENGTH=135 /DNA_ID=CAMNT_0015535411 /DNA_START=2648 /DNA_END=3055 /DNA_ORIENTATION=-
MASCQNPLPRDHRLWRERVQGKGSEWRLASRRRQLQTRSSHHGVMPKPPSPRSPEHQQLPESKCVVRTAWRLRTQPRSQGFVCSRWPQSVQPPAVVVCGALENPQANGAQPGPAGETLSPAPTPLGNGDMVTVVS